MTTHNETEEYTALRTANDGTLARVNGANKVATYCMQGKIPPVYNRQIVHTEQRTRNLKQIDASLIKEIDVRTLVKQDVYEFLRVQQQAEFAKLKAIWQGRPWEALAFKELSSSSPSNKATQLLDIFDESYDSHRRYNVYRDLVTLDQDYLKLVDEVKDPTNAREKKFRTRRSKLLKSYLNNVTTKAKDGSIVSVEQKLRQDNTPKTLTKQIKLIKSDFNAFKRECAKGWTNVPLIMEYFNRLLRMFKRLGRVANKIRSHKRYDRRVVLQTKFRALQDFTKFAASNLESFMSDMGFSPLAAPFTNDITEEQLLGMSNFSLQAILHSVAAPGLDFKMDIDDSWTVISVHLDVVESEVKTRTDTYEVDIMSDVVIEVPEERSIDAVVHVTNLFARKDAINQVLTLDVEQTNHEGDDRPVVPELRGPPLSFAHYGVICFPPTRKDLVSHLPLHVQARRKEAIHRILREARIAFSESSGKRGNRQRKNQKDAKPRTNRDYNPVLHQALYQSRPGLRLPPRAINRWAWRPHRDQSETFKGVSCGVENYMNPKERDGLIKCHVLDLSHHVEQKVLRTTRNYFDILKLNDLGRPEAVVSLLMRKFLDLEILEFATTSSGWTEKSNFHKKSKAPKLYAIFRDETQDVKVRDIITRKPVDRMLCGNFSQVLIETNKEVWSRVSGLKFPLSKEWTTEDLMSIRYCVLKQNVYVDPTCLHQAVWGALLDLSAMLDKRRKGGFKTNRSLSLKTSENWDRKFTTTIVRYDAEPLSHQIAAHERRSIPVLAMHSKDLATWAHDDWTAVCGEINRNLFKELHGTI